jgi:hypothetical protein
MTVREYKSEILRRAVMLVLVPGREAHIMVKRIVSVSVLLIAGALMASAGATATLASTAVPPCDGQWALVPSSDHSQLSGEIDSLNAVAALSSTDQWAVGSWLHFPDAYVFHTLVEHWDGSSAGWTIVPSPNSLALNSYLYGVAADAPNDVWAVGGTDQSGPPYQSLVEHWDGTSWSVVFPASFPGVLYGVAALGPNDVWAVGTENYPGRGLIEHWDGTTWKATYLRFRALLRGIAAVGPQQIWAVGQRYGRSNPFGDTTLAMHFNGRVWTAASTPNPLSANSTDQNWLTSVSAVAADDVWAVGRYGNHDLGPLDQTLIEHWNGARWTVVPSPDPGGSSNDDDLWGIAAVAASDAWAVGGVGSFLNPQFSSPLTLHWDGSAWTQLGVPAPAVGELLGVAAEPAGAGVSATGDTVKPAQPNPYVGTLAEHLCPG